MGYVAWTGQGDPCNFLSNCVLQKKMVCWLEGPDLKGAGVPLARIVLSVENLSAQRITSKYTFECTQVREVASAGVGLEGGPATFRMV